MMDDDDGDSDDDRDELLLCQAEVLRRLVAAGVPVDAHSSDGATPLQLAVEAGRTSVVAVLLSLGADVNLAGSDGETPLGTAARVGVPPAIVALLLGCGADVGHADVNQVSPLLAATRSGLDSAADIDQKQASFDLALSCAALLCNAGANATQFDTQQTSALHEAARSVSLDADGAAALGARLQLVRLLISAPHKDLTRKNSSGFSALHLLFHAIKRDDDVADDVFKALVIALRHDNGGLAVRQPTDGGSSVLDLTTNREAKKAGFIKALLDAGACTCARGCKNRSCRKCVGRDLQCTTGCHNKKNSCPCVNAINRLIDVVSAGAAEGEQWQHTPETGSTDLGVHHTVRTLRKCRTDKTPDDLSRKWRKKPLVTREICGLGGLERLVLAAEIQSLIATGILPVVLRALLSDGGEEAMMRERKAANFRESPAHLHVPDLFTDVNFPEGVDDWTSYKNHRFSPALLPNFRQTVHSLEAKVGLLQRPNFVSPDPESRCVCGREKGHRATRLCSLFAKAGPLPAVPSATEGAAAASSSSSSPPPPIRRDLRQELSGAEDTRRKGLDELAAVSVDARLSLGSLRSPLLPLTQEFDSPLIAKLGSMSEAEAQAELAGHTGPVTGMLKRMLDADGLRSLLKGSGGLELAIELLREEQEALGLDIGDKKQVFMLMALDQQLCAILRNMRERRETDVICSTGTLHWHGQFATSELEVVSTQPPPPPQPRASHTIYPLS